MKCILFCTKCDFKAELNIYGKKASEIYENYNKLKHGRIQVLKCFCDSELKIKEMNECKK